MISDSNVEEVRRVREELIKRHGGLDGYLADWRRAPKKTDELVRPMVTVVAMAMAPSWRRQGIVGVFAPECTTPTTAAAQPQYRQPSGVPAVAWGGVATHVVMTLFIWLSLKILHSIAEAPISDLPRSKRQRCGWATSRARDCRVSRRTLCHESTSTPVTSKSVA